ncbi:hypothetical protein BDN70DRAFT_841524 [Pholiota conissans]|uniref:SUZ domain-containing protein n=1 Tax=Pholiota conissans TaxID=109636 RepID=A0A9P5YW61_9AGAR|nr:hypothetical protein BDN70DRAFT_841524 [Pholiota conissans]
MALDPTLVVAQSDPALARQDPNFRTNNPDHLPSVLPMSSTDSANHNPAPASPYMDATVQDDTIVAQSFSTPLQDTTSTSLSEGEGTPASSGAQTPDVDPQILEALKSKDRIYVLKLGETFEALIMERRQRVELSPATSYQRLLVHRCSAYYRLAPEADPVTKGIFVMITAESCIPERRIAELVPAESTTQPAFKIMQRGPDRRNKPHSLAGSVGGDDQELSDVEQSESGSLGGRSMASSRQQKRMTIEEREAAYNEARSRIFMDFEEKGKDKDISASSSTLSLNGSASTSAGGRSSVGDTDDAVSSPGTESEWSVPSGSNSRDKKDGRRGGPGSASASSTRSIRTGGSFQGNGSGGSSRNSRAPSPSSFSYASLHDTPMGQIYDPSQHSANQGYYGNQYHPYSPPGAGPSPPFLAPYPYYPQQYNPYPQPPIAQHNPSDPNAPSGPEPYSPPHQMTYGAHYGWSPHPQPPLQSPPHSMQMPLSPPLQPPQNTHPVGIPPPLPAHSPQYQPFMHPSHAYSYPMNGYYQPPLPPAPGQQGPPPPPPAHMNMQPPQQQQQQPQQAQQQHQIHHPQHHTHQNHQHNHPHHHQQQPQQPSYDVPRGNMNGNQMNHSSNGPVNHHNPNVPRNGLGNGVIAPNNNGRSTSRNGGPGGSPIGGAKNRSQAPPPPRTAWSYGPGVGIGGYTTPVIPGGSDAIGPRFNNSNRRLSGNSSSGGNSRASSTNDDVSSTSSSTTSSSSRRTFTSTTSSQHPLPPRPDWAVGLKAQPTLAGRHHDISLTNSRTMSPISPPRSNGHNSPMPNESSPRQPSSAHPSPPVSLHATDFPPLTSGGTPQEKKTPVATGAWGNARPVLTPNTNGNSGAAGGASSAVKYDESGTKAGELFNPKLMKRAPTVTVNGQSHQRVPGDKGKEVAAMKCDASTNTTILAGQVEALSVGEENGAEAFINLAVATNHDSASATSAIPASREKETAADVTSTLM